MYLHGAAKIYTADINSLLSNERVKLTCEKYIHYFKNNKLPYLLSDINEGRISALENLINSNDINSWKEVLNISIIVDDILKFTNEKIDLIHSNNTLEHINKETLKKIFKHFNTIIAHNGGMSHFIDMTDHFCHFDKSITPYHFLKYSDKAWNLIDNGIQPQNRLRINEYRNIFSSTGWNIIEEQGFESYQRNGEPLKIHSKFKEICNEDLFKTHILYILKHQAPID
jgi:hypothetical protein